MKEKRLSIPCMGMNGSNFEDETTFLVHAAIITLVKRYKLSCLSFCLFTQSFISESSSGYYETITSQLTYTAEVN